MSTINEAVKRKPYDRLHIPYKIRSAEYYREYYKLVRKEKLANDREIIRQIKDGTLKVFVQQSKE
jgi:hypothetical protein